MRKKIFLNTFNLVISSRLVITGLFLLTFSYISNATTGNWVSKVTGGNIGYTLTESPSSVKDFSGKYLTVVYLENVGFTKIGGNSNATDVEWLLSKGYRVIELNYANNISAVTPTINADIIAINDAIAAGSFCGSGNCSQYKSYVLFEGYRIARDVSYFKDDPTVYNYSTSYTVGDSLHMDIIYPANASFTVPVVLSFSYSNSYFGDANKDQRMNLGNTLAGFNDSFLEGAPANGIAWAIADHPKYCPWGNGKPVNAINNKAYGSYETNPDAAQKVKSAVRTLRVLGEGFGFSGKIGIYGFSRGSTAGSMAVGDKTVAEFENAGLYIGTSDNVQVAALGSGVFDYSQIYNTAESDVGTLLTNCPSAWGDLASNYILWQSEGSYNLIQTAASSPVIFFYNTDDASYYQDQIMHLKAKLDSLSVPTDVIINYGTGHAVPQTDVPLSTVYNFFTKYLTPPLLNDTTHTYINQISANSSNNAFELNVSPNPVSDNVQVNFNLLKAGSAKIEIYDLSGKVFYATENQYNQPGVQLQIINLNDLKLPKGNYFVKFINNELIMTKKFIKN